MTDVDQHWTVWVCPEGASQWHSFMYGTYDQLRDRLWHLYKDTKASAKLVAPDGTVYGYVRIRAEDRLRWRWEADGSMSFAT